MREREFMQERVRENACVTEIVCDQEGVCVRECVCERESVCKPSSSPGHARGAFASQHEENDWMRSARFTGLPSVYAINEPRRSRS